MHRSWEKGFLSSQGALANISPWGRSTKVTQGYVFWELREHISGADVLTVGQVIPKVWEGIRCQQLTGPWKASFIKLPATMLQASLPSVGLAIRQQREVDCGKVCVCSWFKKMVGLFLTNKIVKHLPTRSRKEITHCPFSKLPSIESKQPTPGTGSKEALRTSRVSCVVSLKRPAAIRSQSPVCME